MHIAGHAVGGAEQRKLRHYSDYPCSDHLVPAAIDIFSCMGPRFHTLLENIASLGYAQREDMLPAQMGMPAAYLSFLQRRVSACLQRAQAHALHQKAGRALAGSSRACRLPSGIRASVSDLFVLTRAFIYIENKGKGHRVVTAFDLAKEVTKAAIGTAAAYGLLSGYRLFSRA
eukprot:SM000124S25917  [mRNA]  locus=s124:37205:38722:+ [translate_table: standard]